MSSFYLTETSTKSLIDFFAETSCLDRNEFYLAQEECKVARYALKDKLSIYSNLKKLIAEKTKDAPEEAFLLLGKLDKAADNLVGTVDRVVSLLKRAAEINILSSSQFDGVQLFYLVQQIPKVIGEILQSVLTINLEILVDTIIQAVLKDIKVHTNGEYDAFSKDILETCDEIKSGIPLLVAEICKEVVERLTGELQTKLHILEGRVISHEESKTVEPVSQNAVDGLEKMIGSVPTYDSVPTYSDDSNGSKRDE